jgi:hypothetical protein
MTKVVILPAETVLAKTAKINKAIKTSTTPVLILRAGEISEMRTRWMEVEVAAII